jgi:hypothetical protein
MRKLLFFIAAAVLFVSCSNTSEDFSEQKDTQNYDVTFGISGFKVDAEPLQSKADASRYYCRYVIYNEDGSLRKDSIIRMDNALTNLSISEKLPTGKYNMAIMHSAKTLFQDVSDPNLVSVLKPENFNTDYCEGNIWIATGRDNKEIYYQTVGFSVVKDNANTVDVELEPMWSTIDINVTDAATCNVPENATAIACVVEPFYYGFNIKTKVPTVSNPTIVHNSTTHTWIGVSDFQAGTTPTTIAVAQSKDVTIKLVYYSYGEYDQGTIVGERTIYNGDLERGLNYKFTGKIGNGTSEGEAAFNITKKGFAEKEVPFE